MVFGQFVQCDRTLCYYFAIERGMDRSKNFFLKFLLHQSSLAPSNDKFGRHLVIAFF